MAGYSGTPLWKKLGIKAGARLRTINPPGELEDWLHPLPENVNTGNSGEGQADVILFFITEAGELEKRFPELSAQLHPQGGLWVCWPKQNANAPTDLAGNMDGNIVRSIGLAGGLVDNKVCAVSEVWSGLRFVYRLGDRPGN